MYYSIEVTLLNLSCLYDSIIRNLLMYNQISRYVQISHPMLWYTLVRFLDFRILYLPWYIEQHTLYIWQYIVQVR
jgi:hypothetical protein